MTFRANYFTGRFVIALTLSRHGWLDVHRVFLVIVVSTVLNVSRVITSAFRRCPFLRCHPAPYLLSDKAVLYEARKFTECGTPVSRSFFLRKHLQACLYRRNFPLDRIEFYRLYSGEGDGRRRIKIHRVTFIRQLRSYNSDIWLRASIISVFFFLFFFVVHDRTLFRIGGGRFASERRRNL